MDDLLGLPRLHATPAGIHLGPLDAIVDGKARGFVLQLKAGRFHGFVIRRGDRAIGYLDQCPHAGLPLAQEADDYLTSGGEYVICGWHGALFDIERGGCVGGPCRNQRLTPWPVASIEGEIVTA